MHHLTTKQLLAAAFVASVATAGTTVQAQAPRWYVGHLGGEDCVPLDDIGDAGERLYYQTGKMRTPEDYILWMQSNGVSMRRKAGTPENVVILLGHAPGSDRDIAVALFADPQACAAALANIPR